MIAFVVCSLLVAYAQAGNIAIGTATGITNTASVAEARAGGSFSYNLKEGGAHSVAHHTVAHVPAVATYAAHVPAVAAVAAPIAAVAAAPAVATYGAALPLPYAHHGLGYAGLGYAHGLGYAGYGHPAHDLTYNNFGAVPYGLGLEANFDNGHYKGDPIYL